MQMAGDPRTRYLHPREHYLANCQVTYKNGMKIYHTLIDGI